MSEENKGLEIFVREGSFCGEILFESTNNIYPDLKDYGDTCQEAISLMLDSVLTTEKALGVKPLREEDLKVYLIGDHGIYKSTTIEPNLQTIDAINEDRDCLQEIGGVHELI
ncbi:hypothetical protein N9043_00210 [bacterium]|nr:hypothetical protein [bacterium]